MHKCFFLQLALVFFIIFFLQDSSFSADVCGGITIQEPFDSELRQMLLCQSDKLYMRSTVGLFEISSIDYVKKLLSVRLNQCASASSFVSPNHLSAGFPPPPIPNSLVLLNCSNTTRLSSSTLSEPCSRDGWKLSGSCSHGFGLGLRSGLGHEYSSSSSSSKCVFVRDVGLLGMDLDPAAGAEAMKCTHYYSAVYRKNDDMLEGGGMKISFEVTNPCDRCRKPGGGDCGAALRCLCHAAECKDKIISGGGLRKKTKKNGSGFTFMVLYYLAVWGVIIILY
ncbi:uncharacterized protein LOC127244073 [Andrographis paniculata]|uniref:uncharacterized protein LOC127244073 n=1 Tax=Andrographis paniculata TaxID=175694 RepID=UPI0021E8C8E4|nr:uncharacterized protein LOC127244073 [Andrographis paniculata]